MADPNTCPTRDDLQQMVLGQLTDADADAIQLHLDRCRNCLNALQDCVASDELLDAVQASRPADCEPTKTMFLPIGWIRDAVSTWVRSHDRTQTGQKAWPPSMADVTSLLGPGRSEGVIGRIGDFDVLRVLGAGGMAVVFEAEDTQLKRRVALKLMRPAIAATPGAKERFLREARSAAALKHPNVMTIHQVGMCGETPFMALELLRGETLENYLTRKGRLSVDEVVRIGREIALGLAAAHARDLLHRDIKPANIWLEDSETPSRKPAALDDLRCSDSAPAQIEASQGATGACCAGRVKILDFGLAKTWTNESGISYQGLLIGTPAYMSPEQLAGGAVDPRMDLFSLGCLMYRMAIGKPPFGGADLLSVLRALALEEPAPVRAINPQIPKALSDLIGELLSKSPDQRPPSAQVVADRLQAIEQKLLSQTVVAKPDSGGLPTNSRAKRGISSKWAVGAMVGVLVLLPLVSVLFGAQIIRIATNKGQIVIKVDDPAIEVLLKENHAVLLDRTGHAEITLAAGEHQLEVTVKQPSGETTFNTDKFVLSRGGEKVIEVREELAKAIASRVPAVPIPPATRTAGAMAKEQTSPAPPSASLDCAAAMWVLSLGGNVTVRAGRDSEPVSIERTNQLPASSFELTGVGLQQSAVTDAGLAHLRGLTALKTLSLRVTAVTDAGMQHLNGLTGLEELLLDATRVSDAGLAHVRFLTTLKTLNLTNTLVTDEGLGQIESLNNLEALWLDGDHVTDAGLVHLKALKNLHILSLFLTRVTDAGLSHLEDLPKLDVLSLRGTRVTDAGLVHLRGLTKLQNLDLGSLPVTDTGLAHVQGLAQLMYLDLESTKVSDAGMAHLRGLSKLASLSLDGTHVADGGLAHISGLTSLKTLTLRKTAVTDEGLTHLAHLTGLESLVLEKTRISDAGMSQLRGLKALSNLSLLGTSVTDAGLKHIEGLTKLEQLWLGYGTPVTDAGMAHLITLKNLRLLMLNRTAVSDAGLVQLEGLPQLQWLSLSGARVTDAGLVHLRGLKNLRYLRLSELPVSDAGLVHLAELSHLEQLDLSDTRTTAARVAALKTSLPRCRMITTTAAPQLARP
jgi:eukaryotic-like serine/threonine-protein kinase